MHFKENTIIIIDDCSDPEMLEMNDIDLTNCVTVKSEFERRAELLPYHYFYKYKPFDKAVIIHDSLFIQHDITKEIDDVEDVQFMWDFIHRWDNEVNEKELLVNLNKSDDLIKFYDDKKLWRGCFGVMSVIEHNFLKKMVEEHNFFNLLDVVKTRTDRQSLERIFALLCCKTKNTLIKNPSIFGDLKRYGFYGMKYGKYIRERNAGNISHLKIVKVASGR